MIKRPLVWLLVAFVLGCFVSSVSCFLFLTIVLVISIWIAVCQVQGWIHKLDRFIIILPLVVVLGYILMNNQLKSAPLDALFKDEIMGRMEGEIVQIIRTDTSTKIFLKDVIIELFEDTNAVNQDGTKENVYYSNKILVFTSEDTNLKVGNQIFVFGQINKFCKPTNLGQFDEYQFYKIQKIDYKVYANTVRVINPAYSKFHALLNQIKEKLVTVYYSLLNEKEAGIVSAMLLGETYLLDEDMKELYQTNGIAHILAISGLHITLIGMCFFQVFQKLKMHLFVSIFFTILLIFLYGILTNFSVSTNRAVVMLVVGLLAKVIGKTYDIISAMCLSALIVLIQAPLQLYSCGFLLSYGAIMGIAIVLPALSGLLQGEKKGKENAIASSVLMSLSVTIMTLPILLYFFYQVPLYSVILNLIVIPLMTLVVMLSFVGGILGCFSLILARLSFGGVHYILLLYEGLCRMFESLPYSTCLVGKPSVFLMLCYYTVLILFLYMSHLHQKKRYLALLLGLSIVFFHTREAVLEITFLDVGQGDGIFFQTPSNTTYLIDGGSSDVKQVGKYRLLPFLKAKRIDHIDYAIMTHADSDHISGLVELLEEIEITNLLVPNTSLVTEEYNNLILKAKNKKSKIVYLERGDVILDNEVTLTCLHPFFEYQPENNNAYSTVIRMEYGEFEALFMGDLGMDGETLLTEELLDCDLLKVAHHGSKNSSSTEFLERVDPEFAIISCGKNNRYGHPHNDLLERLLAIKSKMYITSESGAITVIIKEGQLKIFENNP